jgi:hypothetical protein
MKPQFHFILVPVAFVLLTSTPLYAQEKKDKSGKKEMNRNIKEKDEDEEPVTSWQFGLDFGMYVANNAPANFYNGSETNVNRLSYVMTNKYWYQNIKNALKASDTVIVNGIPSRMTYKIALMGGLFIRFNFNKRNGLCLQANYAQLKADNAITVLVDPRTYLTVPDLRNYPIEGVEYRVMMDLIYQRTFVLKSKINFFVQAGPAFNYTRVTKSSVFFEGTEYSLINIYGNQYYVPNTSLQENQVIEGGLGYGLMFGGGAGFPLTDYFAIEPGFYFHYNNVALQGYNQYGLSFGLYLRILLGNL